MKFIYHNGVKITEAEFARICAETDQTVVIEGKKYQRVRYGDEKAPSGARECEDCGAAKGQLHVFGCDSEYCPACCLLPESCDCIHDLPDDDIVFGVTDCPPEENCG